MSCITKYGFISIRDKAVFVDLTEKKKIKCSKCEDLWRVIEHLVPKRSNDGTIDPEHKVCGRCGEEFKTRNISFESQIEPLLT